MTTAMQPITHETTAPSQIDGLQVWLADDDPDDHLLFALAAEEVELDLTLSFSNNGDELLEALADTPSDALPDLVLIDLRMPGLGGHRTLELLRARPETKMLPIVVFTTSTRVTDRDAALAAGANSVVVKPIRFPQLVEFAASLSWRALQVS